MLMLIYLLSGNILIIFILLVPATLPAVNSVKFDVGNLFAQKKAAIKDHIALNEKQSTVFWPLYDKYEKKEKRIFIRRLAHIREYMKEHKNLSDEKIADENDPYSEYQIPDDLTW